MVEKNLMKLCCLKKKVYSHLNMKDFTDANYTHAKKVCKGFKRKNLGEYRDLFVQSNTLFLVDVFCNI